MKGRDAGPTTVGGQGLQGWGQGLGGASNDVTGLEAVWGGLQRLLGPRAAELVLNKE